MASQSENDDYTDDEFDNSVKSKTADDQSLNYQDQEATEPINLQINQSSGSQGIKHDKQEEKLERFKNESIQQRGEVYGEGDKRKSDGREPTIRIKEAAKHARNRNSKSSGSQLGSFPQVKVQNHNANSPKRNNISNIIYTTNQQFESANKNRKKVQVISLPMAMILKNQNALSTISDDQQEVMNDFVEKGASLPATSGTKKAIPIYLKQPSTKQLTQRLKKQTYLKPPPQYTSRRNNGHSSPNIIVNMDSMSSLPVTIKNKMPKINLTNEGPYHQQIQKNDYKTARQNFPLSIDNGQMQQAQIAQNVSAFQPEKGRSTSQVLAYENIEQPNIKNTLDNQNEWISNTKIKAATVGPKDRSNRSMRQYHTLSVPAQNQRVLIASKHANMGSIPTKSLRKASHFVGSILPAGAIYHTKTLDKKASHRKIDGPISSTPGKANDMRLLVNVDSYEPIGSAVANGLQSDRIKGLSSTIDQLRDELRVKSRLVTKLLEGELEGEDGDTNVVIKLKTELDLAYKILKQRDAEINKMKKQAKQQAQSSETGITIKKGVTKTQQEIKSKGESGTAEVDAKNSDELVRRIQELEKEIEQLQAESGGKDVQMRQKCDIIEELKNQNEVLQQENKDSTLKHDEQMKAMRSQREKLRVAKDQLYDDQMSEVEQHVVHEAKMMGEMLKTLEGQVKTDQVKATEQLTAKAKENEHLTSQITDLTTQLDDKLAEMEQLKSQSVAEIEQLEKQMKDLQNLRPEKVSFADMIATQGQLVEQFNKEKLRTVQLEQQVHDLQDDQPKDDQSMSEGTASQLSDIEDEDVSLGEEDTIESVELRIAQAHDYEVIHEYRAKQRILLKKEIIRVQETLVRKSKLVDETLELQELLTESAIQQKQKIYESEELMLEATNKIEMFEEQEQIQDKKVAQLAKGLKDLVKVILHEQFLAYKISGRDQLQQMLAIKPAQVLEDQFMLPTSTQELLDCSANGLFDLLDDARQLAQIPQHELKAAFQTLKQVLDHQKIDFRRLIFEIDEGSKEEQSMFTADPIMRKEFIARINSGLLNDFAMAEKIATGCQQISRSVCFIHFWAFSVLWFGFNKPEKAELQLKQKEQVERLAVKEKKLQLQQEHEVAQALLLKEQEAKQLEQELQEAARLKEEEKRKHEQEIAEDARRKLELQNEEEEKKRQQALKDEAIIAEEALLERQRQEELDLKKHAEEALLERQRQEELDLKKHAEEALHQRQEELDLKNKQEIEEQFQQQLKDAVADSEGFTVDTFKVVKCDKDLAQIVSVANARAFQMRNECDIYNVQASYLVDNTEPRPFNSLAQTDFKSDVDVFSLQEFFEQVLKAGLGLERYVDVPEETEKLRTLLRQIGAITTLSSHPTIELIRLEVLLAAMRVHGYEYAGVSQLEGFDLRELSSKSIRIMNRLVRVLAQYQDKYQSKAKEGVVITLHQIINAVFKQSIETRRVNNTDHSSQASPRDDLNVTPTSIATSLGDKKVQLINNLNFYKTLFKLRIKKSGSDATNLSRFLTDDTTSFIAVKALLQVATEFMRSQYLRSYGFNKRRLPLHEDPTNMAIEEEGEQYYDEEDDEEVKKDVQPEQPVVTKQDGPIKIVEGKQSSGETEYYDEEEEEEQKVAALPSDDASRSEQKSMLMRPSPMLEISRTPLLLTPQAVRYLNSDAPSAISGTGYQGEPEGSSQLAGDLSHRIGTDPNDSF